MLEELGLFNEVELPKPTVLFLNFDSESIPSALKALNALRAAGIKSEIFPDTASSNNQQKKQWKYAEKRGIPFVISNINNDQLTVQDMSDWSQREYSLQELIEKTQS